MEHEQKNPRMDHSRFRIVASALPQECRRKISSLGHLIQTGNVITKECWFPAKQICQLLRHGIEVIETLEDGK
jgi:hypothetical protein